MMRYLPHTEKEIGEMLQTIGVSSIDELFRSIPDELKLKRGLNLPSPMAEADLVRHMEELSATNTPLSSGACFFGAGCYNHYVPAVVSEIASRSEFVTPYTPYQPEISQGTLQVIFEYQTMICRIFGMDVSNASHYDGATAAAEAVLIAAKATKRDRMLVPKNLHPEYRAVIETITKPSAIELVDIPYTAEGTINASALRDQMNDQTAGCIVGYPNFFGCIEDLKAISDIVHAKGGLLITSTSEPISLGMIEAPGNLGADIATGEGQAFGGGMNFGGPGLGIFAVKQKLLRNMPGRIVGETTDADGKRGFVLTFATREQHIRREKATSNICSNEALMATTATIYLCALGKEGFAKLAAINHENAEYAKETLSKIPGVSLAFNGASFNEFVIKLPKDAEPIISSLKKEKIMAGVRVDKWYPELKNHLLVCVTEVNRREDVDRFAAELKKLV